MGEIISADDPMQPCVAGMGQLLTAHYFGCEDLFSWDRLELYFSRLTRVLTLA
jgi:hypothetical protein